MENYRAPRTHQVKQRAELRAPTTNWAGAEAVGVELDEALDQPRSELSVRLEYYQHSFFDKLPAPAALQGLDRYQGLLAIPLQVGFSY